MNASEGVRRALRGTGGVLACLVFVVTAVAFGAFGGQTSARQVATFNYDSFGASSTVLPNIAAGAARSNRADAQSFRSTRPVMSASSLAAEGVAGAAKITFGHGARHLVGTGLDEAAVNAAIKAQVEQSIAKASATGSFWGRVTVGGKTIEYRAYTLKDGTINAGTYYVPK